MTSKKLDAATRDRLAGEIKQTAAARSIALVEVEEIDAINNYWAGLLAMRRAIEGLSLRAADIGVQRWRRGGVPNRAQSAGRLALRFADDSMARLIVKTAHRRLCQRGEQGQAHQRGVAVGRRLVA